MPRGYDFGAIEKKWQGIWDERRTFAVTEDPSRPKYYCLEMYPYPSGKIHMGHVRNYSIGDVVARYLSMRGYNVLHPMGWDAFGFPAENAAFEHGIHPAKWTRDNIAYMKSQLRRMGFSYDWDREVTCCEPDYYRWNQWFFLQMLERGLAYQKTAPVNWCERCQSVLSNEQAEGGVCWRHGDTPVVQRELRQWFFRITAYVEELLRDLETLPGWPERVRTMQRNWIGKSVGAEVDFALERGGSIRIFTTRPDTLYGATFMVLAPEHPLTLDLSAGTPQADAVAAFVERMRRAERTARTEATTDKEGVFTGAYAINPLTRERIPIWVANFILMEYGTGAIMAVPAHDQRDFDMARKYQLPIRVVIQPTGEALRDGASLEAAFDGDGRMVNSGRFTGMANQEGLLAVCDHLEEQGTGTRAVNYRIRDWLVSRQRYWGTPIPVIYCDACGVVPVPERDLPVILPQDVAITMSGGSPLARVESFAQAACPTCGRPGRRETDTMDTFVDSSWYFLRFTSPHADSRPLDATTVRHWMPVDQYIGGIEHAVPAPALRPLLHQGLPRPGPQPGRRAVHQPADAGHGLQGVPPLSDPRVPVARRGGQGGAMPRVPGPGGSRADREDVEVEEERGGPGRPADGLRRGHHPALLVVCGPSGERPGVVGRRRPGLLPLPAARVAPGRGAGAAPPRRPGWALGGRRSG